MKRKASRTSGDWNENSKKRIESAQNVSDKQNDIHIPQLPPELIKEICSHLPQSAWKNALVVNRVWNEAGKRAFIQVLIKNLQSSTSSVNKKWKVGQAIGKFLQFNRHSSALETLIQSIRSNSDMYQTFF